MYQIFPWNTKQAPVDVSCIIDKRPSIRTSLTRLTLQMLDNELLGHGTCFTTTVFKEVHDYRDQWSNYLVLEGNIIICYPSHGPLVGMEKRK